MERIAENIYVETEYEGVNVGAVITRRGIIAIDVPSYPRQARDWSMRLQALISKPIQYVILTDYNGDRILNARWLNAPIITHDITAAKLLSYDKRFPAPLLESLTMRNPQRGREFSSNSVQKPAISFSKKMKILRGEEEIQLIEAIGPTSSNIVAYIPDKEILFTGDTAVVNHHPFLLEPTAGQWLQTLEKLDNWPHPVQQFVPGRGPLVSSGFFEPIQAYLSDMRTIIQEHIDNGRAKEETAVAVSKFISRFPHHNLPDAWLRQQIKRTLDHIYDELQLEKRGALRDKTIISVI